MAVYQARKFTAKNGQDVVVRSATVADAEAILTLAHGVYAEEIYQLTSVDEFSMTIADEEKWIGSYSAAPGKIIFVSEMNAKVVGILDFANGRRRRVAHTGEFGMSVAKSARDQGIGTILLTALLDWASQSAMIEKIDLSVHANNARAIGLYQKMGFEIEGVRKRNLKYAPGQYVDTVIMGRLVK